MNLMAVYTLLQKIFLKNEGMCRIYHNRERKSGSQIMPATLNEAKSESSYQI
jgi:hypothetical protein